MSIHDLLSFALEFDRSMIIESYSYKQELFDSSLTGAASLPELSTALIVKSTRFVLDFGCFTQKNEPRSKQKSACIPTACLHFSSVLFPCCHRKGGISKGHVGQC
ncbi:hypothetical protein D3C76_821610 [compost metagenome]